MRGRKKGCDRERRGGINFRVGAGKPDRLTVTLNLSFRNKIRRNFLNVHT